MLCYIADGDMSCHIYHGPLRRSIFSSSRMHFDACFDIARQRPPYGDEMRAPLATEGPRRDRAAAFSRTVRRRSVRPGGASVELQELDDGRL